MVKISIVGNRNNFKNTWWTEYKATSSTILVYMICDGHNRIVKYDGRRFCNFISNQIHKNSI